MTGRPVCTDPRCSAQVVVAFCVATYASAFAMAYAVALHIKDRLTRRTP